jgi:hypothetical protein
VRTHRPPASAGGAPQPRRCSRLIEVAKIKPTKTGSPSAVFTSKFCHFLLPRVFPVLDNVGLGGARQTYESYFKSVQNEWMRTSAVTRHALITELTDLIKAEARPLDPGVPPHQQDRRAATHRSVPPSYDHLSSREVAARHG